MALKSRIFNKKPEDYSGFKASVSKVKVYDKCTAAYRYNYIERLPKKQWAHSIFGNISHKILEKFDLARLAGNTDKDHTLLSKCYNDTLSSKEFKNSKLSSEENKELYNIFNNYLQKLHNERKNGTSPKILSAEEKLCIDIDGKVLVTGVIDKTQIDSDGTYHVKDYKSSKSKHAAKYLAEDWFQLETYCFYKFLQNPELKKIRGSYELIRFNFECVFKEFTREKTLRLEKKFLNYAEKISKEKLFRPTPSKLCEYCDYLSHCKVGKDFMMEDKEYMYKHGMMEW